MATSEYTQSKSIDVDKPDPFEVFRQNAGDKLCAVSAILSAIQWMVEDDVVKELCDRAAEQIEELEIDMATNNWLHKRLMESRLVQVEPYLEMASSFTPTSPPYSRNLPVAPDFGAGHHAG